MHKRFQYLNGVLVLCLSLVLGLLAGGVLSPRTAHAATQVSVFRFHGNAAFATFDSLDATGCIETSVGLGAGESMTLIRPGTGAPQQMPDVAMFIDQFNNCTGALLKDAFGNSDQSPAPVINFHLAGDLSSATVTASGVVIHDSFSNTDFEVNVTMMWDGTGSTMRQVVDPFHFNAGGVVFNEVAVGVMRDAVATGTITTDGTTNFTPTPSSSASMQILTNGSVTVTQG